MNIQSLHTLFLTKLERRDKLQKDPFKLVTKCCGGGEANETADMAAEIEKLKKENIDVVKDYHKISVKLSNVEQEKSQIEQELQQTKMRLDLKIEEVEVFAKKNEEIRKEVQNKNEIINVIRRESASHQVNRSKLESDLKDLNNENHRIMDEYAKLEQELRVTKELCSKAQVSTIPSSPMKPAATQQMATSHQPSTSGSGVNSSQLPTESNRQLAAHSSDVLCLRYNSNGTVLASASADKTIKLWDVSSGKIKTSVGGVLQSFTHVSFSPMGDMLLASSNDATAKIWYLANSRLRHSLTGHNGKVTCGEFYDTEKVITGSHDRTIKIWDINKGYCTKTNVCFSSCNCLMLGGIGNLAVSGHCDNTVRYWDIRSKDCIEVNKSFHTGSVSDIVNIMDGRYYVTLGKDNIINYIDGISRKVINTFKHTDFVAPNTSRICVSPDGKYICAGSQNGDLFVWDTQSNKLDNILKPKLSTPSRSGCYAVAWNPVQSQMISSHGNKLVVWE